MSINNLNTYLNIKDSHLRVVSGNVYAQAMNIGGINVETAHGLQSVSDTGNVTSNTLQFSNAITGFVTTANAQIGRDLVVSGNTTVSTDLTVSANATVADTLTISEHLIASKEATVTGNLHVTTIRSDSNVVTEYTGPHDRPLRKYPEVAMTANDNSSTSGYSVVQSTLSTNSTETRKAWSLFNHVTSGGGGDTYHGDDGVTTNSISSPYNNADGTYQENPVESLGGVNGTWLYIRLPKKISLDHAKLISRSAQPQRVPRSATFLGSNNGTDWTSIFSFSDVGLIGDSSSGEHTYTYNVNSTVKYEYFGFVWEKVGTNYYVNIEELELYGHEEGSGSLDTTLKTVYNVPATTGTQLEVYYDAKGESTVQSPIPDLSPNTNTGAVSGHSPILDSTDGIDSFKFNGSSQYVTGAHGLTTGSGPVHTISLWLNATEMTNYTYAVQLGQGGTSHQQSAIMFYENKISHAHWGSGVLSDITIAKNVWYHVVAVFTGGNGSDLSKHKIFINGEDGRVGPFPGSTDGPVVLTGTQLTLGRKEHAGGTPGDYFNGSIANFRLYSKALNADQVKELYDYQKDYFLGSKSQVTLYKGHLGVGVTEPSGQLELAGDERIQEYPPRGLTGYETLVEGHGVFCVSASSYNSGSTREPYKAFNNSTSTSLGLWQNDESTNKYSDAGNGTSNPTTNAGLFEGVYGEWIKLELPLQIKLFSVFIRSASAHEAVNSVRILGSNDGNNWDIIKESHTLTYVSNNATFDVSTSKYYSILVLQVLSVVSNGSTSSLQIYKLKYFGTPGPTTLDKGSLTLGRSLDVPRISRYDVDTETPRPEKLVVDFDTTVNNSPTDISGQGNHGVFVGTAQYSAPDKAFNFSGWSGDSPAGTEDWIQTTATGTSGNFIHSVSMWVKSRIPDTSTTSRTAFHMGNAAVANQEMQIQFNYNSVGTVYLGTQSGWLTMSNMEDVIKQNQWHHIAYTYNGTNMLPENTKFYIDGTQMTMGGGSSSTLNFPSSTEDIFIGRFNSSSSANWWNGQISNFKLYSVALEASEVQKLYRLGRTGRSMVISDTAVGIGKVPEAQLDVRGVISCNGAIRITGADRTANGSPDPSPGPDFLRIRLADTFGVGESTGQNIPNNVMDNGSAIIEYTGGQSTINNEGAYIWLNGDTMGIMNTGDTQTLHWYDADVFPTATTGRHWYISTTGAITNSSDLTLKNNIRYFDDEYDISNSMLKYSQIKFCKYNWKKELKDPSGVKEDFYGVIAQEIEPLFPEMIKTDEGGLKMIKQERLQYISYHMITNLIQKNADLEARILALENKDYTRELRIENNRLKSKVTILENRQTHFNTLLVNLIGRIETLERPT